MANQAPAGEVEHADLLRKFMPAPRYDTLEMFFADSAATWTDFPGNELRRVGQSEPLATTAGDGPGKLSLELLARQASDPGAPDDDYISCPNPDYRDRYHRLRDGDRDRYVGRVHCRAAKGSDKRLWLQYWLWYVYNDYNLAGKIGLHEGDWELVQLQMKEDLSEPDLAIYSQHHHAEIRAWPEVWRLGEEHAAQDAMRTRATPSQRPDRSPTPLVYPARGSHANYFEPGEHTTDVWWDVCDGGMRPTKPLEPIFMDAHDQGWSRWRGRWGDTPVRPTWPHRAVDQPSPESPCMRTHWENPAKLREKAIARPPDERSSPGELAPKLSVERRDGRLRIDYDFRGLDPAPYSIEIGVNSEDELATSPRTYTFRVEWIAHASFDTRIPCSPRKRYDVRYSTTDEKGQPTMSRLCSINVASKGFDVRSIPRRLNFVGRFLDRFRRTERSRSEA